MSEKRPSPPFHGEPTEATTKRRAGRMAKAAKPSATGVHVISMGGPVWGRVKLPTPLGPVIATIKKLSELSEKDYPDDDLGRAKDDFDVETVKSFLKQGIAKRETEADKQLFADELFSGTGYKVKIEAVELEVLLPSKAPLLWEDYRQLIKSPDCKLPKFKNAAEFTADTYKIWIGHGLTRELIKKLDPPLSNALGVYIHRNKGLPFDLPTRSEVFDRKAAKLDPQLVRDVARVIDTKRQRLYRHS